MGTSAGDPPRAIIMAFRALVVATLVAYASAGMDAGYMQIMMQNMMNMGQQQASGGGNPATGHGCTIPQGQDAGAWMQQQKQQQQYEQQQMAEKIKAQFETVMKEVTMKKHKYAMHVMTEFTTMCACLEQSYTIYQSMFVDNAKKANLTGVMDLNEWAAKKPYDAKNLHEARELIFGGMLYSICTELGKYMTFAQQVEQNIPIYRTNQPPPAPAGK